MQLLLYVFTQASVDIETNPRESLEFKFTFLCITEGTFLKDFLKDRNMKILCTDSSHYIMKKYQFKRCLNNSSHAQG